MRRARLRLLQLAHVHRVGLPHTGRHVAHGALVARAADRHRVGHAGHRTGTQGDAVVALGVVPVPRGDDHGVFPRVRGEMSGDGGCHGIPARDGERAALGEVVLHVDDEECSAHPSSVRGARRARKEGLIGQKEWMGS